MSEAGCRRQDHERGEPVGEPPNKQMKSDPQTVADNTEDCQESGSKINIHDLPQEAIVNILSFLSFSELTEIAQYVCSQWLRASHNPVLWSNKEYCVGGKTDREVLTTLPRVPQLRTLVLKSPVTAKVLRAVYENCIHLKNLEIAESQKITHPVLSNLVFYCNNIQTLTIPDRVLVCKRNARILAKLERLRSLEIVATDVDSQCIHLAPLAKGCPQLSKLRAIYTVHICREDFNKFLEGKCKTLSHLALNWSDENERCVVPLLKNCTALANLELYGVYNGEILQAFAILSQLPNLRSLTFSLLETGEIERAFSSVGLSHLKVLKISLVPMQNGALDIICKGCPHITELQLNECKGLRDADLKGLQRLSNLETLAVISCEYLHGEAVKHIAQLSNLRKLVLTNYNVIALQPLIFCVLDMTHLEILSFESSYNAAYFPFNCIPSKLTNLRVLNVACCNLEERILLNLTTQMPRLMVIAPAVIDRTNMKEIERMMKL